MQRSMRRAVGALTTVGCSSGGTASSTAGGSSTGKLVVCGLLSGTDPAWKRVMTLADEDSGKAHPDVTIDRVGQSVDPTGIHPLLQVAAQAKFGPDLVMMQAWGDAQGLEPTLASIEQYITPRSIADRFGWDSVELDGHTCGVPIGPQGLGITFNKQVLAKARLNLVAWPNSVSSLVKACTVLNKVGVTPIAGGNNEGYRIGWMYSTMWPEVASAKNNIALVKDDVPLNGSTVTAAELFLSTLVPLVLFIVFSSRQVTQGADASSVK